MRAIGIDLGTTNSAAAIGGKEIKVLPTGDNEMLTPSVVSFVKKKRAQGEIVVGRAAVNNALRDPENTVFSIKRLMGLVYGEERVEEVRRRASFKIADPPAEDAEDQSVKVLLGGEPYSAVEISALILKQARKDAEQALGEPVTHAVITVPAYFQERQRNATGEAGRRAGLEVLKIIDEPTAAAIAFGAGKEEEKHRVLVYDLGGGTFDISIIQMVGGQYQNLEIMGDTWLGGDDFDRAIVQRMIEWVKEECDGYDPSDDRSFLAKAREHAQKVKIALSRQESVEIFEPLLRLPGEGVVDVDMEVTRKQFESDIEPLVDKTIGLVDKALGHQNLTPEDITEVLLVGGSTAVPKVLEAVAGVFGSEKVKRHVNPMECVALGAAILADKYELKADGATTGERVARDVVEVTAMHLGIAAVRGNNLDAFVPIIPKGTPYPLTEPKQQIFFPTEEGQHLIKVPVYEGLNELASLNEQQGTIEFPLPEGIDSNTSVEVSFNYDRNRILTVGIRVVGTDHSIEETLRRDRGRAARARREPESLMDDWREDLQPALRAASHFLNSYGVYMGDDDRDELQSAVADGDRALKEGREIDGKRAIATLQHKIMGSGSASLLFMAERVMQGASEQIARKLALTVAQVREALEKNEGSKAEELGLRLRMLVAQVMGERARIDGVEDSKNLEHLLQVRD